MYPLLELILWWNDEITRRSFTKNTKKKLKKKENQVTRVEVLEIEL